MRPTCSRTAAALLTTPGIAELVELDRNDIAVGVLRDEHQVEDPYGPGRHQIGERRRDLAGEIVPGEPQQHQVDRTCDLVGDGHVRLPSAL